MFYFFEDREECQQNSGQIAHRKSPLYSVVNSPSPSSDAPNINILKPITAPVALSEMSYPTNKSKLFYSANNVPTALSLNSTNALSKSAGDIPTTPLIPRVIGFGKNATTVLVPTIISTSFSDDLVTPAKIEYEEGASPTSGNNSNNNSWLNDNYFPPATRQNANLPTEVILTANTGTSTDSYYTLQKNNNASLSTTSNTGHNNNTSSSENENGEASRLPSPTEQNEPLGDIFDFDNS